MEDMGIRRVVTHGEKAAPHGRWHARASHSARHLPGSDIGSANLAPAAGTPTWRARPVIALTGGVDAASRYKGTSHQESKTSPLWEQVTKAKLPRRRPGAVPGPLPASLSRRDQLGTGPGGHLEMAGTHAQVSERDRPT